MFRVFARINLVMYSIGESALVIQGETGMHSLCYHHFEPHFEKLKLCIIHTDDSYNCRSLRIRSADCFFFLQDACLNFSGIREAVRLALQYLIEGGIGAVWI